MGGHLMADNNSIAVMNRLGEAWAQQTPKQRDLINPNFDDAGRVHDWRTHMPHEIVEVWMELDYTTRLAVALLAERLAENESWE